MSLLPHFYFYSFYGCVWIFNMCFSANAIFNQNLDFPQTGKGLNMALTQTVASLHWVIERSWEHAVNTSLHLLTCFPLLVASHFILFHSICFFFWFLTEVNISTALSAERIINSINDELDNKLSVFIYLHLYFVLFLGQHFIWAKNPSLFSCKTLKIYLTDIWHLLFCENSVTSKIN